MTSYGSEEVKNAVEKLVRGSIRRPLDPLGVRRSDVAYSDIQEAGATVLLLNASAPFYILSLGAQRLRDAVATESALLDQLLDSILATGRRVLPIKSVDSLFGAKAALEELETAAASRSQGFRDITKVPSYQRFASSVQSFLDGPAQNVKSNGSIVETPEEARQAIPPLLKELQGAHLDLVSKATALAAGIDDFRALNLPALVATGAISRARQVIGDHAETLDQQSSDERLLRVREVTLDVLAAKAVVTQFGSFSGPTAYFPVTGVGAPYADPNHSASTARVTSSLQNFSLLAGSPRLDLTLDGTSTPISVNLTTSRLGEVHGRKVPSTHHAPGFLIGDGTNPPAPVGSGTPDNNELRIQIGLTTYVVPLTNSVDYSTPRTAQEVCDDINLVLPAGVRATAGFSPLEYSGPLDIAPDGTMSVPGGASDLLALGVRAGHLVRVLDGPDVGLYAIDSVSTTSVTVPFAFSLNTGASAEMGPPDQFIRIACVDPALLAAETKLTVLADTEKSANACSTLGFFPGIFSQCQPTTVDQLVADINGKTAAVIASSDYEPVTSGTGTTSTTQASLVTMNVPVTVTRWMTLRIDDGPNRGDYLVAGPGAGPNDVLLQSPLPMTRQGVLPISFSASVGNKRLVLSGKTTGMNAAISVSGPTAGTFFTTVPAVGYGTTTYFQLPSIPRGLSAGDVLELYDAEYNAPSSVFRIVGIDTSLNLLELGAALSTHLPPSPQRWVFGDQPPPFARLRAEKSFDFMMFQTRVSAWAALSVNQASYFTLVNAKINPLLVNRTPTAAQVGDATNALSLLYQALAETGASDVTTTLEYAVAKYVVPPVPAVDTLLKTYKEKGSDRATDLLLAGSFSTFFSLTVDETSYGGAMQSAMRGVAREDVAVRKTGRTDAVQARQLSQAVSPDYDYDSSDIEGGGQVDPPE